MRGNSKVMNLGSFMSSPYKWEKVASDSKGEKKKMHGLCRACMQGDCSTIVHMEDGIATFVEGDPECRANAGKLCPRGNSAIMNLYNPYRVKTPLKRTNPERGLDVDPGWVEISWDEALDTVAEKLKAIREKDPRGFVVLEGWGQRETVARTPFCRAFGTPNELGAHGPQCSVHYATNLTKANTPVAVPDLEYCDYHITIGRSVGPNFATSSGIRRFVRAKERGMKFVVVDPRSSHEASKGQWVPIRPGTDLAFVLAMANVMFYEIEKYDLWFLKWRTNAPYLIKPDGYYMRDPENGKPMLWDAVEEKAKSWDKDFQDIALHGTYEVNGVKCRTAFDVIKESFKDYTPEWQEKITTVPPETIRQVANEFVEHARIGSTIEIDGFEFPYRPVSINCERNTVSHRGGVFADLTTKIISMLVGSMEVPGGNMACGTRGPVLAPDEDGTVKPAYETIPWKWKFPPDRIDVYEFYPNKHTGPHLWANAMLNPEEYYHDYKVEAFMNIGGNIIKANAQPEKMLEAYRKVPFIFSISYHMDEPTIISDIVLPEHSYMERMRAAVFWPQHQSLDAETHSVKMVQIREPVPNLFNTMHVDEIIIELADRIGILYGENGLNDQINKYEDHIILEEGLRLEGEYKLDLNKRYSIAEIFDRQIKTWTNDPNKGLDYMFKNGIIQYQESQKFGYNYYYCPDKTTRHPFYFNHLRVTGDKLRENMEKSGVKKFPGVKDMEKVFNLYDSIPKWVENSELNDPDKDKYDMFVCNWKTPYYSSHVGDVYGNPWLAEAFTRSPYELIVHINTDTGKKKGFKDGDEIVVESKYGKTQGKVRLTETMHPETVGIPGGNGLGTIQDNPLRRLGPHVNSLQPLEEETFDYVNGGQENCPRVRVYKAIRG